MYGAVTWHNYRLLKALILDGPVESLPAWSGEYLPCRGSSVRQTRDCLKWWIGGLDGQQCRSRSRTSITPWSGVSPWSLISSWLLVLAGKCKGKMIYLIQEKPCAEDNINDLAGQIIHATPKSAIERRCSALVEELIDCRVVKRATMMATYHQTGVYPVRLWC